MKSVCPDASKSRAVREVTTSEKTHSKRLCGLKDRKGQQDLGAHVKERVARYESVSGGGITIEPRYSHKAGARVHKIQANGSSRSLLVNDAGLAAIVQYTQGADANDPNPR